MPGSKVHSLEPLRIHELDGLRGFLALYVAAYHLANPLQALAAELDHWLPAFRQGWYAVDVFFIMSGFVMMHVYAQFFVKGWPPQAVKKFYIARVARLYPVHIVALIAMVVVVVPASWNNPSLFNSEGRFSIDAALAALFMLHGPWIDHRTWNYPSWSISAEWHAYLLFPFLAGMISRSRGPAILFSFAACTIIPFALYIGDIVAERYPTNGPYLLVRAIPLFIVGMAIYRLRLINPTLFAGHGCTAMTLGGTLLALSFPDWAPFAVLMAPFVVMSALGNRLFGSVLRHRSLLFLGAISYSLYMTHALVEIFGIGAVLRTAKILGGIDLAADPFACFFVWCTALIISLLVGTLTWQWIEVPGRKFVLRLLTPLSR